MSATDTIPRAPAPGPRPATLPAVEYRCHLPREFRADAAARFVARLAEILR